MCKQLKINILNIYRPLAGNISPFPIVVANTHFEQNFASLWGAFAKKRGCYVRSNKKSCPFRKQLYHDKVESGELKVESAQQ